MSNPMSDDQDVTLLLGFLAARLGRWRAEEMCTLHPDQIELRSPWTGRRYALTLRRLKEPGPPGRISPPAD
jgi:hypothetical protein